MNDFTKIDDLRRIYAKEKLEYGIRMMKEQNTFFPEYYFETFKEWMESHGYSYE